MPERVFVPEYSTAAGYTRETELAQPRATAITHLCDVPHRAADAEDAYFSLLLVSLDAAELPDFSLAGLLSDEDVPGPLPLEADAEGPFLA